MVVPLESVDPAYHRWVVEETSENLRETREPS
jgi:hypothetical protein